MSAIPPGAIHIAAALIDDDAGRVLLVRKSGTSRFMQAGGKIQPGETPLEALVRELLEEIGLDLNPTTPRYLGRFSAPAANEPGFTVLADLFHVRTSHDPILGMEIEEAEWMDLAAAHERELAPLTRDYVLPLARDFHGLNAAQ